MQKMNYSRRNWLITSSAILGCGLISKSSLSLLISTEPKILSFDNLHTGESLQTEFFNGQTYNYSELEKLNYLFRDFRTNTIMPIDPTIFDILFRLQWLLEIQQPFQLISGYRSLKTNNQLRIKSKGVAKNSYHTLGRAMDFYLDGVELARIRKAALQLRMGGVGYYPKKNFIHIDTGPFRVW